MLQVATLLRAAFSTAIAQPELYKIVDGGQHPLTPCSCQIYVCNDLTKMMSISPDSCAMTS